MAQNTIETIIGFIVIAIAASFFAFSYTNYYEDKTKSGYTLIAKFQNAEGINKGSDVTLAGIKIGTIESMVLDKESFFAVVKLKIDKYIQLPVDSQAAIVSNGFLGDKFVSLTPGSDDKILNNNDIIKYTQSSIGLESLIGKFMYYFNNKSQNP